MPVHEIRYQTWEGRVLPPWLRLLAIPRFTLLATFNKWIALGLFSGGVQLFAFTGYLLLVTNPLIREMIKLPLQNIEILSPAKMFLNFYVVQFYICMLVSVLSVPKMISPEIQHHALPMIYSRPISRTGYIFGKFLSIGLLLSALTWVQAFLLFIIMMVMYTGDFAFWRDFWTATTAGGMTSWLLGLKAVVYGLLLTFCLGMFALACSSATKNFLHASILFFVILFGSSFMTMFIQENFMATFPDLGLRDIFESLSYRWFSTSPITGSSYLRTCVGIGVWGLGSYLFMRWRLRPVDVYKD